MWAIRFKALTMRLLWVLGYESTDKTASVRYRDTAV